MSSPNGESPLFLYDLMRVADFGFISKPLYVGKRRQVYFNDTIEVFYTISRVDIMEHNIKSDIWWNNVDYTSFKLDIDTDTKRLMNEYPGIDYYSARKILCSPYFFEEINE
jgi:hypothetical protein